MNCSAGEWLLNYSDANQTMQCRYSLRPLDQGQAHQGPILPQGDAAYVMYFAENLYENETSATDMALISKQRSVLQVGFANCIFEKRKRGVRTATVTILHWSTVLAS